MSKKALTGGTGDVNPQWQKLPPINLPATSPASGLIFGTTPIPLPVNRFGQKSGKSIVVEALKIRWAVASDIAVNASAGLVSIAGYITTTPVTSAGAVTSSQARVIDYYFDEYSYFYPVYHITGPTTMETTMSGSINGNTHYPIEHDLTDGAGHGVLIATDQISLTATIQVSDIAPPNASTVHYTEAPLVNSSAVSAEILYRFKEVKLEEYIGIVQSQQQTA